MAAGKPSALDERRAEFARYKDDVKKRGKPFYPFAMFEDTVMSVFVVSVIIALATIWKWTSWAPHHDGTSREGRAKERFHTLATPGVESTGRVSRLYRKFGPAIYSRCRRLLNSRRVHANFSVEESELK